MFLRRIDLLSEGPQISIFNEGSNKTVFGGALSLIYLIFFLLIAVAYLVDYISNDKYDVQYGIDQKILDPQSFKEMSESPDYNPTLKFRFSFEPIDEGQPLSDRFALWDDTKEQFIKRGENISLRLSDINLGILYKCENRTCLINDEDKTKFGYIMNVEYQGYELDHQGKIPIHKADDFSHYQSCMFFFEKTQIQYFVWGIIKYSEEKAFLGVLSNLFGGEDEDLVGGYFKDTNHYFIDGILDDNLLYYNINGTYYKLLSFIFISPDYSRNEEYKRTKRIILDVFADISALSMTILEIFAYVFGNYYSGNFDNYKIIQKVLSKEKKMNKNRNKDISEEKDDKKKHIELIDSSGKSEALIENSSNLEEKEKINEDKKYNEGINFEEDDERTIPQLRFIDFMTNSFYSEKCCKSSNRQQIISSCNDLVAKYYTIEDIIYNQIKIENLLKDYKWNDPKLKNIENNECIIELKSYYNI